MIPQRWIEAYLRFLLRYRAVVTLIVAAMTAFFSYQLMHVRLHTNFLDFYPKYRTAAEAWHECRGQGGGAGGCLGSAILKPGPNPYIQFYSEFRKMFGTV